MCDIFSLNYAGAINAYSDPSGDLVPCFAFFTNTNCESSFQPPGPDNLPPSNPYTQGQVVTITNTPQSMLLPFNFRLITLTSASGKTSSFHGPLIIPDLSKWVWQSDSSGTNMVSDGIVSVTVTTLLDWTSQSLLPMCMGKVEMMGRTALTRYYQQGQRCDEFMGAEWCIGPRLTNTECGCFEDLPEIEKKSVELKVDLPVLCFGPNCANNRTYKTAEMMNKPCNLTICEQTIAASPGIINEGQDVIFCGGQFFKPNGIRAIPTVTIPTTPTTLPEMEAPWYVWIMFAVSGILFIVLVYLLFTDHPTKESALVRQLKQIAQRKNSPA